MRKKQAAKRVPSWKATLLDVLTEKVKFPRETGDLHWHYAYEVNNLIDGRRSVLDIYRIVRAAALSAGEWYYGKVELSEVNQLLAGPRKGRRHQHSGAVKKGCQACRIRLLSKIARHGSEAVKESRSSAPPAWFLCRAFSARFVYVDFSPASRPGLFSYRPLRASFSICHYRPCGPVSPSVTTGRCGLNLRQWFSTNCAAS